MSDNSYYDVNDLRVGDRFMEDSYDDDVYVVEEITDFGVKAKDEKTGEVKEFGYSDAAYAPVIIKL